MRNLNGYQFPDEDDEATREPVRPPIDASATRFATNRNWSYRGDNTKYKRKK